MTVEEELDELVNNLSTLLKTKNQRYGNSALEPMRVFGKGDGYMQICSRIDDKLSRVRVSQEQGQDIRKNDITDLVGYLLLLMLYKGWTKLDELID